MFLGIVNFMKTINPHYLFVIRDFRAAFAGSLNAGTKINKIKKNLKSI